ncbi:MAG: carotenoid biosynthesis protein [Bacteroidota bacterium]
MLGWLSLTGPTSTGPVSTTDRLFRVCFALFTASIVFSLAGTLVLQLIPSATGFFAPYMESLIKAPTWTYMAMLPLLTFLLYLPVLGWGRSVGFLLVGSLIGAAAELAGTTTGLPFGPYMYTTWLGAKIAGHVPWFIPPSWYAVSVVCYDLAQRMRFGTVGTLVGGALLMVIWDVALDPAMSKAFPFWIYPATVPPALADTFVADAFGWLFVGVFFGMPLMNWVGWFVTSLLIMLAYRYLFGGIPEEGGDARYPWAAAFFALNMIFPMFVSLLYGVPRAAFIGALALVAPFVLIRLRREDETPAPIPA